jgi:hypothetical protein
MSAQLPLTRRIPVTVAFYEELASVLEPIERFVVQEGEIGAALVLYTRYGKRLEFYHQPPAPEPPKEAG